MSGNEVNVSLWRVLKGLLILVLALAVLGVALLSVVGVRAGSPGP